MTRDLNDLAQAGELPEDLLTLCDIVHKASAVAVAIPDGKPIIKISTELHRNVDEAEAVLGKDSTLYQRDGQLVRLVRVAKSEATASVLEGTPTIRFATAATIKETLAKHAQWLRYDARADDWCPALPTRDVVEALMARGQYPHVRPITGIVESPMWLGDNRIMQEAGYDSSTGYVYAPTADFPMVPEVPTPEDVSAASELIKEIWGDFEWRSDDDRSVAAALLFTMICRSAVGDVPAFGLDASIKASGKGLAVDACACAATGRRANKQTYASDPIEQEKILGSMAMVAASHVAFDDIKETFGGNPLCKVLTCGGANAFRVLGKSQVANLEWRAVVTVTGNNISLEGDVTRRIIMGRLEPTMERPELRDRSLFRHPDLLEWVTGNRGRIVAAVLTLVRAWYLAGRPGMGLTSLGSFECWAALVPPVLVWSGIGNPLVCCPSVQSADDPETMALATVMASWHLFAPRGDTIRTVIGRLWPEDTKGHLPNDSYSDVREALLVLAPPKRDGGVPDSRAVGKAFDRAKGRIIGGMKLSRKLGHGSTQVWSVAQLTNGAKSAITLEKTQHSLNLGGVGGIGRDSLNPPDTTVIEKLHIHCDTCIGGTETIPPTPSHPSRVVEYDTSELLESDCVACLTGRCYVHQVD